MNLRTSECPYKKRTHTCTEDHVKMEADTRVVLPQAKKYLRLLETGRGKEALFSGA